TTTGGLDIFVAKYSSSGACSWSKDIGGMYDEAGNAVAVDASSNILLTGEFRGTINFGGATLTGTSQMNSDIFLAKLNSSGGHIWSKDFGNGNTGQGLGVAVDTSGNVVMTGAVIGAVNFGGGPTNTGGMRNAVIAKFSSTGGYLWSRAFTSSGFGYAW